MSDTQDETMEDVKAAYALLFRDMAALRVKADALANALEKIAKADASEDGCYYTNRANISIARTAIANYTGEAT